jgi:hypothetical protein
MTRRQVLLDTLGSQLANAEKMADEKGWTCRWTRLPAPWTHYRKVVLLDADGNPLDHAMEREEDIITADDQRFVRAEMAWRQVRGVPNESERTN